MDNTFLTPEIISGILPPGASVYFAGIGGVSMAGLARIAAARGYRVRGCDRSPSSEACIRLLLDNIAVEAEDAAEPGGAHVLVFSAAISPSSPAIRKAVAAEIPRVSRADFLAAMMAPSPIRIAVAGMHGKSTTTGMLSAVLEDAGLDPTVAGGAPLTPGGDAWRIGSGDIFLAEACEYRDSFLSLSPCLSVVTNMELDHPDYFPNIEAVEHSFAAFLSRSETAVIGGDCPRLHALAPTHCIRFGTSPHCFIRGESNDAGMRVWAGETLCGTLTLHLPGAYNYENALAAFAAAYRLGIPPAQILSSLSAFRGIGRRMEYRGQISGARVYLDYAHHPTELTAAITAAHAWGGRVIAVFQPHTYTRTRALWEDFITALRLADYMVLVDIFAAREPKTDGTSSSILAAEAGVDYAPTFPSAAANLRARVAPGDTLLILGAGDIDAILPLLLL